MCSKMEDSGDRKEKEKVSSSRRNNKPLMEKRRRQRINDCLVQLKSLVLQAMNKDTTQYSKLEKADILEMTVKHLKMVQRQQMTAAMATDPNVISKYRAGFNECASEIARYLDTVNGGNPELKARVMNYLANSMMQFPVIPVYQGVVSPYHLQMASPMASQHGFNTPQQFAHGNVPLMNNESFISQHHLREQRLTQQRQRNMTSYSSSSEENFVKHESSPINVNVELSPGSTSLTSSPIRRIPSPCDSDSGLSDSSASFTHDENGNYSHFDINNDVRQGNYLRIPCNVEQRLDLSNYSTERPISELSRQSVKRKSDNFDDENIPKRSRQERNDVIVKTEHTYNPRPNDPMWRPW